MRFPRILLLSVLFALPVLGALGFGAEPAPVALPPVAVGQGFQVPTTTGDVLKVVLVPSAEAGKFVAVFVFKDAAGQPTAVTGTVAVVLGLNGPLPSPGPLPQPDLTGLAKLSRDWAAELVPKDGRAADAAKLAQSFDSVAVKIAAGVLKTADEVAEATTEANRAALGERRDAWVSWGRRLAEYLVAEAKAERLKTPEDHQQAWGEIAKGLRAVQ